MEHQVIEAAATTATKRGFMAMVKSNPVKTGLALVATSVAIGGVYYMVTRKSSEKPITAEELTPAEAKKAEEVLSKKDTKTA